ncbi:thioredoxin [Corynebacterium sp. TAE3-ERU12]|uniref:thioredoxin n=1 Tax=Corynebacterium sp. TAE3-ERU12 TaxID=2849491 RepID=UPI001C4905F9|nr:thioredoxin [Corynebacterium sp. TAE3-ERU12]MBV7294336.1 thioredoxin [Corynebacterium sp. TAE3-ERU12]
MTVQTVTAQNFREAVADNDKLTLVDFWASWCGPCRALAPVVEELSEEMADQVDFAKVDVDAERELGAMFQIMSLPSLLVFKDGKKVDEIIGAQPKANIRRTLEKHL